MVTLAAMLCLFLASAHAGEARRPMIDDRDITRAIETELRLSEEVSAHLVDVKTDRGVVTLAGTVDHLLARNAAVRIARGTRGVLRVADNLEVSPKERPDEAIRSDARAALSADAATEAFEVDVAVDDGVVTLTGVVDSYPEKHLAGRAVRRVRGVRAVDNEIEIEFEAQRPDGEIAAEIRARLRADVRVDDKLIDVAVDDGFVTLTGAVGSAAERKRASAGAWISGVRGVDASGLEVKWWARDRMRRQPRSPILSDEEIEVAYNKALRNEPQFTMAEITAESDEGVVTIAGVVETLQAKRRAEALAEEIAGVRRVRNFVRVRPPEQTPDENVREQVRESLQRDPYLQDYELEVRVRNGKVYLRGTVDTHFEKSRAGEMAAGVFGVVDIANNLAVAQTWTWKDDLDIHQDLREQIFWNPRLDPDEITVYVDDGEVTLEGTVDTWFQKRQATEEAWDSGAADVDNELRVRESADYIAR
jgi:osmotically-inducible protein OsmY